MDLKDKFNKILENIKKATAVPRTTVSAGDDEYPGAVISFSDPMDTMISKSPGILPDYPKKKKFEVPEEKDLVNIDFDTILASTQKLLAINKGLTTPDERDSLRFRRLHPVNELMRERIRMDADKVMQNAMRKVSRSKSLRSLGIGFMNPYTEKLLIGHALSMPLEEINPMHLVEQARRITQMGPGGLPSSQSITVEANSLHPSEFGFISVIEGPECFDKETEVYTKRGWVKWEDISNDDLFACNINGRLEFHKASRIIRKHYKGEMIGVKSRDFNFLVTPNHRMWSRVNNVSSKYKWEIASEQYGKNRAYSCIHKPYVGTYSEIFTLPEIEKGGNAQKTLTAFNFEDWAEFMGWFLSEGSCHYVPEKSQYRVRIHQNKEVHPEYCEEISKLLTRMNLSWCYAENAFHLSCKQLVEYLHQYGLSYTKFIPDYLLEAHVEARQKLLNSLIKGDARKNKTHTTYCSVSERLAKDVQRLMISLGLPTNFRLEKDSREHVTTINYCACQLKTRERISRSNKKYDYWYKEQYDDVVYCATVPGGMLFTKRGRGVPFWSGNSERIGVDTRAAWGAKIGSDGKLYQRFYDRRNKRHVWLSPTDLENKKIGLPE